MRILFISTKSPYPISNGHSMRTFNLLKQATVNHEIYFLTYFLSKEEEVSFYEIVKMCVSAEGIPLYRKKILIHLNSLLRSVFSSLPAIAHKYYSSEMNMKIRKIIREHKIDIVHIDMLPLMVFAEIVKDIPIVLVDHNVESILLKRMMESERNIFKKIIYWWQWHKLYKFEKKMVGKAKVAIGVSENDIDILKKMNSASNLRVISNGVDINFFNFNGNSNLKENNLIYVGGLNWFPNNDAMKYFCEEILPLINAKDKVNVQLIGKTVKGFKWEKDLNVLGYVEDIRPYIEQAKVFIVPLRIGGGTRLKILDAMAMGKSIVSTSIGCEGLHVENEKHLLIRDDAKSFAKAVLELLSDEALRKSLGARARELVETKYSWKLLGDKMNDIYSEVVK